MGFADAYLSRQQSQVLISENPANDLEIITIIPVFNESGLTQSLDFLLKTIFHQGSMEIICLINHSADDSEEEKHQNEVCYRDARKWAQIHNTDQKKFHILFSEVPDPKNAGVGFARKLLMDEAVRRFNITGNEKGIICSLDADTLVDINYHQVVWEHLAQLPDSDACSIYFEHPLSGNDFPEEVYRGIIFYELHMRYYLQGLRYSEHPNCYHTVGSAFAVKALPYCQQGGMNRRKAGEDFYFLQKFFDIGRYSDCVNTVLTPSPRPSSRVPFGTGPVIRDYLKHGKELKTYNPQLFTELKQFFNLIHSVRDTGIAESKIIKESPGLLKAYLETIDFQNKLREIIQNSSDIQSFRKRFFRWFNMFRVLKFLNFARQQKTDLPVTAAAAKLLELMQLPSVDDPKKLLIIYRERDRHKI